MQTDEEARRDVHAKEQESSKSSKETTIPANRGKATQTGDSFHYVCSSCNKIATSTIRTGQVDHRRTCGNRFQVRDGVVGAKAYVYVCPRCNGHVKSSITRGKINHQSVCGHQFSVKDGIVAQTRFVYVCPFCSGIVHSKIRTGRVNHRPVCNNWFHVKDGAIGKHTWSHAHRCPVCSTVVWSSKSSGRIAVRHDMPSGKRCHKKQWHVPDTEKQEQE